MGYIEESIVKQVVGETDLFAGLSDLGCVNRCLWKRKRTEEDERRLQAEIARKEGRVFL